MVFIDNVPAMTLISSSRGLPYRSHEVESEIPNLRHQAECAAMNSPLPPVQHSVDNQSPPVSQAKADINKQMTENRAETRQSPEHLDQSLDSDIRRIGTETYEAKKQGLFDGRLPHPSPELPSRLEYGHSGFQKCSPSSVPPVSH
jgi:hypothetical protein